MREIELVLSPEDASSLEQIRKKASKAVGISPDSITDIRITKRSIDARKKPIVVRLCVGLSIGEPLPPLTQTYQWKDVHAANPVIVVGAGPAGLFASLRLLELGYKPIIVERGKKVSDRKLDIASLSRNLGLNPDSNYCFGEGGAGTFSDGKLHTRSKKRGNVRRILEIFYLHGADASILYDSHPHLGTDRLPAIITAIRESLIGYGAEFHYNTRIRNLIIKNGKAKGVTTVDGDTLTGEGVILATGHSATDIYQMLDQQRLQLQVKGFAMGVRIEHSQSLIDQIQYHSKEGRGKYLPAAEYSLVKNIRERGVYSFCMCPGGMMVPSATSDDETVVNGMSNSLRNSRFANSGLVVEIRTEDLEKYSRHGAFAGLAYQTELEQAARRFGGEGQIAPAQRLTDFIRGKSSASLPQYSYHPGLNCSPMHEWLPESIRLRLQESLQYFGSCMKGFLTSDAIMAGVESRTSSPIRILRDPDKGYHPDLPGLFPAGEGAGYAGGIVSSAIDGENAAEAVSRYLSA